MKKPKEIYKEEVDFINWVKKIQEYYKNKRKKAKIRYQAVKRLIERHKEEFQEILRQEERRNS